MIESDESQALGAISVPSNFAIVVPDKGLDRFALRKRFVPIVNSGREVKVAAEPAQDFGFDLKIGKGISRKAANTAKFS